MTICTFLHAEILKAQCNGTWTNINVDSFESSATSPHLISGTVYHLTPMTFAARTGNRSIYMNFVNGLNGNTLVYERSYNVCAGQQFSFRAYFIQTFSGSSTVRLDVRDGNNNLLHTSTQVYSNNGTWALWQSPAVVCPTNTIKYQLTFVSGVGGNDLSMDDLTLRLCQPAAVNNGTFSVCSNTPAFSLLDSISYPSGTGGTWTGPSGLTGGSSGIFDATTMSAGTYFYTITGSSGGIVCPDSIGSIQIQLNSPPPLDLGKDTLLCSGDSLLLFSNSSQSTFSWQDGSIDSSFLVKQSGLYWVDLTKNGCTTRDSIQVDFLQDQFFELPADTLLCFGDSLLLDFNLNGASYTWGDGATDSLRWISNPGLYTVTVNSSGCSASDSIELSLVPESFAFLPADTSICTNETLLLNAVIPNGNYLWQDGSSDSLFEVSGQGVYWVTIDLSGCVDSDTIIVDTLPLPLLDLGLDTTLCKGKTITLGKAETGDYLWNTGSTLAVETFTETGWYWQERTVNGCTNRDSIYLEFEGCEANVVLPNVFSPNGDMINDFFTPVNFESVEQMNIVIYNRWGHEVYSYNGLDLQWDGKSNQGQNLSEGVYFYFITTVDALGNTQKTNGEVSLYR